MLKIIFSILFLFSLSFSTAFAAVNPINDPNLVLFYQHQGLQNFLLKNSIHSHFQNSLRVISFDFISFDSIQPDNTDWQHVESMQFAFDESNRKVYFFDHNGNLDFLDPNGTIAQGSGYAQGAEIVYFLATRHKFYGTFDDNFYTSLALKAGAPTFIDNKNFILFADLGIHGAALYVDRKSVNLIQQDDGGCIISIDEVQIPDANFGSTQIANRFTHHYSFNTQKMLAMRFIPESDNWVKINPTITNPDDPNFTYDATIAEIAYYLTFGKKFFHTFDDNFYVNLN